MKIACLDIRGNWFLLLSRISLIIFFLIALMWIASSLEFGVSPGSLDFYEENGESICRYFKLVSDYEMDLIGDIYWSKLESKNVNDFDLESGEMFIDESFEKNVNFVNYTEKKICLSFEKNGKYYGLLIYKIKNGMFGVGIWLKADIGVERQDINKEVKEDKKMEIFGEKFDGKSGIYLSLLSLMIEEIILLSFCIYLYLRRSENNLVN